MSSPETQTDRYRPSHAALVCEVSGLRSALRKIAADAAQAVADAETGSGCYANTVEAMRGIERQATAALTGEV